jgi:hypothetical protein
MILRVLHDPTIAPVAVAFGDSVIISGIDTRILQAKAQTRGRVFNLS